MVHEMRLNIKPFNKISEGTKTIEMRLYDEKRRKINIGDIIQFTNREDDKIIKVEVINLYIESSFEDLYKKFDKVSLGYNKDEIATYTDMDEYYTKEDIEKYGVVGIEIKLI